MLGPGDDTTALEEHHGHVSGGMMALGRPPFPNDTVTLPELGELGSVSSSESAVEKKGRKRQRTADGPRAGSRKDKRQKTSELEHAHSVSSAEDTLGSPTFGTDEDDDEEGETETSEKAKRRPARKHACPVERCGKAFLTPSKLKAHLTVHDETPRYSCGHPGCDASFAKLPLLYSHTRKDHVPTCLICGKTFMGQEGLRKHGKLLHVERQEFPCEVEGCGKVLTSRKYLTAHIKNCHSNGRDRPFACTHPGCGERFAYKHVLQRHELLHQGVHPQKKEKPEKPPPTELELLTGIAYETPAVSRRTIPCLHADEGCPFMFTRVYDMERHVKSKHKEGDQDGSCEGGGSEGVEGMQMVEEEGEFDAGEYLKMRLGGAV